MKVKNLGMRGARDTMLISVDGLSASFIQHLRPYFLCRLVQNNFKSKTKIEYIKPRKAVIIIGNPKS